MIFRLLNSKAFFVFDCVPACLRQVYQFHHLGLCSLV